MSGVATHYGRSNDYKEEFARKLSDTTFEKCTGMTVMKHLKEGKAEAPPSQVTKDVMWKVLLMCYEFLPDVSRCSTSSSESELSTISMTSEDLKDSFMKFRQDLLETLPGLVTEILAPTVAKKRPEHLDIQKSPPSTPVKRYVNIKDKEDNETPICEKKWTDLLKPQVETALKNIPVLDTSVNKRHTQLFFATDNDLKEAEKALSPLFDVTMVVEKEKKKDPRLMINDLDNDLLNKDSLMAAILSEKNDTVKQLHEAGHTIKVVHVNQAGKYAVIQVPPEVRKAISDRKDRIFLKLIT